MATVMVVGMLLVVVVNDDGGFLRLRGLLRINFLFL